MATISITSRGITEIPEEDRKCPECGWFLVRCTRLPVGWSMECAYCKCQWIWTPDNSEQEVSQ